MAAFYWLAPCGSVISAETSGEVRVLQRQHQTWCVACLLDYQQTTSDHITDEEE